jgi:hypothetical protein
MACSAYADDSRPSLFNCVLKPGGTGEIRKTHTIPSETKKDFTRIAEQLEDIESKTFTARETAFYKVGRHQDPPTVTIARVECKW